MTMKQKIRMAVLFGLLAMSLVLLAMHIFPELGRQGKPSAVQRTLSQMGRFEKIAEIPLGKVEIRGFRQMGSTPGLVRMSPGGDRIAVGTENGDVMVFNTEGSPVWRRKIGMGKISALEYSPDGRLILIGETSQQGAIICVDAATGGEKWRRQSVDELGVDLRQKTFPGIMSIAMDDSGNAYAVALRSLRFPNGQTDYFARIYKIDTAGKVELFPRDHNLDVWVSWCDIDSTGKLLVFGTSDYTPGPYRRYQNNIYQFDARTGENRWSLHTETVEPYERTNMRFGPKWSQDGKYMSGVSADGRAFFVDAAGKLVWSRVLSAPQRIQGVFVNATGLHTQHIGPYAIFSTGNTYNRANWQLPTPVEHPQSNSVFLFDREGNLLKRRKLGGMIEEMKPVGQELAVAIGRNIRTKDASIHGVALLSTPELELVDWLPAAGPCVAVAASPKHVVTMEAPLQLDNGEVVGDYRILVWKKSACNGGK